MNGSGLYTIDSFDYKDAFGYLVKSGSDDLLQLPDSKEVYTKDWKGQNGKQYDLSRRFFEDKIVTFSGYIIADDKQDFWAKYLAFWDLLKSPGSRSIYSFELEQTFAAFYLKSPNTKRFTRLQDHPGKIAMKLDIQFQVMFVDFEPPVNVPRPPIVNAGSNRIITLPTDRVTVNNASAVPRGGATIVSLLWESVSSVPPGLGSSIEAHTTITPMIYGMTTPGVYTYRLTATDSNGLSAISTMSITVNPAPALLPPLINTGGNKTITLPNSSLVISGASVTPRSGSTITYLFWEAVSFPTFASITNSATLTPTFSGMTSPGVYVFRLTGEDSNGLSANSTVTITVNPEGTISSGFPYTLPITL